MKDVILCDYGKSYLTGCYFINLLDYTTDEEIEDIKTFKTENEMMRYIRENNLINGSDKWCWKEKLKMDINKLKGKIREKRLTYKILAQKIGIGLTSMNYKINGKNLFNQEEMKKLKEALRLTDNETIDIFFS